MVRAVLGIVHDIGVTSIILRFVYPEWFGVFSSPVHALLLVNRMSTLGLYLAYCDELIEYKKKFDLSSAAEAEMALTGLYEIMKTRGKTPGLRKEGLRRTSGSSGGALLTLFDPFLRSSASCNWHGFSLT